MLLRLILKNSLKIPLGILSFRSIFRNSIHLKVIELTEWLGNTYFDKGDEQQAVKCHKKSLALKLAAKTENPFASQFKVA
jgi:hypothetical protein